MKRLFIILIFTSLALTIFARNCKNIDEGWRFTLGDSAAMALVDYDDSSWRLLDLPHDWAIEGDFLPTNPSGASGGALPGGIGWYRKELKIEQTSTSNGKFGSSKTRYFIDFDGVYMNSTVYFNGHKLGFRPYGYSSFRYEITPYINEKGKNIIAVRVDNSDQPNSRWYSGCGIYRHVWLIETAPVSIAHWGTYVTSQLKGKKKAVFTINIDLENKIETSNSNVVIRNTLFDKNGAKKKASLNRKSISPKQQRVFNTSR